MAKALAALFGLTLVALATFYLATIPQTIGAEALPTHEPDLANGERMFYAGGCSSCHATPGAKDKTQLGGGLALKTPFGTFYAPNISPDRESGIGGWTAADFVTAMARGVSPDGEHYYPAFPYTSYQRMAPEDLIDLKAYLDTLPPVSAGSRAHELPLPFRLRRGIGLWKWLYMDGERFAPDSNASDPVNRGAYLVEGPGHCGECHTPRDALGGMDRSRKLAGGPAPEGKGTIPNITPHPSGIGDWSEKDIAYALESGFTPEFDSFGGSMVAVQENMARLPAEDRAAIAAYLKSVPPVESAPAEVAAAEKAD